VTETNPNENKPPAAPLGEEARQQTIDILCESFARDEMDMEEFEQRVELVYRAESMEQLRAILADLPTANLPVTVAPRPTIPPERIPEHSVMVGIMGSGGRRDGAWVPARHNWAVGVMSGCELDFREAQLGPGVTEVHGFAIMGGVEVLVPLDVRVECSGIGIMGGFDHKGTVTSTKDLEAPVIRVTGVAIMGSVEVRVRYPGETARDARLRLKAERKALRQIASRSPRRPPP
jgi:hypothetical protein